MNAHDLKCLEWKGGTDGELLLLDQRLLPEKETWAACRSVAEVAEAIRNMTIRGAPAIGIAAAYGMVIAARSTSKSNACAMAYKELGSTRPTAVNLFWALDQCLELAKKGADARQILELARRIHQEDIDGNYRMGKAGAEHIESGMSILTHCNAGALATGGVGTALGVIFVAHEQKKKIHVFVDETRPRLQGAKLTTWELEKVGVPYTLICDNMAASLMAKGKIQMCVTGADRIAANGDAANKIGTYSVAVNASFHEIPFHIAAPKSTFDLSIPDGAHIPIEERSVTEVSDWVKKVYNPGFDVTPARLIRSIFTNLGEIAPVRATNISKILGCDTI